MANIQPAINNQLGQTQDLPWVGVAYALGGISLLPWYTRLNLFIQELLFRLKHWYRGKAYGTFNIKSLYLSSVAIFEIGSAICGAAQSMDMMIVGRVIAGLGGNGMYTGCLTCTHTRTTSKTAFSRKKVKTYTMLSLNVPDISLLTSTRERPLYMSGVTVVWGGGTVLGPLVGGAFAESPATWRWVSISNIPSTK